jgi:succinate dehydrogenase / fumarate reductase cytochrome b subunit
MNSLPVATPVNRAFRFYDATIGKKAVMAATGVILFAFVLGHLAGNLQIFEGREKINAYGVFLQGLPGMLWTARLVLLTSVILHIVASIQLARLNAAARPVKYVKTDRSHSSYASRTMMWSGPIIAAFIVFHILHFTLGTVHPNFQQGDIYSNVVLGFQQIPVSLAYIFAMLLLGQHLYHGVYSMFQSLGAAHPSYTPWLKRAAAVFAVVVVVGNCSIPIAVMTGWLHL